MSATRCGMTEWSGHSFRGLSHVDAGSLAVAADAPTLDAASQRPGKLPCPFQQCTPCAKLGGVCSIRPYGEGPGEGLGRLAGEPVVTCRKRFEEDQLLVRCGLRHGQCACLGGSLANVPRRSCARLAASNATVSLQELSSTGSPRTCTLVSCSSHTPHFAMMRTGCGIAAPRDPLLLQALGA